MSPKCFRFKREGLQNHAPGHPGVYEFITFDADRNPEVLYVGVAMKSLYESIAAHMDGKDRPDARELFSAAKDVYFDYVASSDIESSEDLKDIAGAFIRKNKPRLNSGDSPSSGKYGEVFVEEV